jgi:ribosome-associated protein
LRDKDAKSCRHAFSLPPEALPVVRDDGQMRDVGIRDTDIRLGQFLKLADAVEVGSDVKLLLMQDRVTVNGEAEVRRGRQLHIGDIVVVDGGEPLRVRADR